MAAKKKKKKSYSELEVGEFAGTSLAPDLPPEDTLFRADEPGENADSINARELATEAHIDADTLLPPKDAFSKQKEERKLHAKLEKAYYARYNKLPENLRDPDNKKSLPESVEKELNPFVEQHIATYGADAEKDISLGDSKETIALLGGVTEHDTVMVYGDDLSQPPKEINKFLADAFHLREPEQASIVSTVLGQDNNPLSIPINTEIETRVKLPVSKKSPSVFRATPEGAVPLSDEDATEDFAAIPRVGPGSFRTGKIPDDMDVTIERPDGTEETIETPATRYRMFLERARRESHEEQKKEIDRRYERVHGKKVKDLPQGVQESVDSLLDEENQIIAEDLQWFMSQNKEKQDEILASVAPSPGPLPADFENVAQFYAGGFRFEDDQGNEITDPAEQTKAFEKWKNAPTNPDGTSSSSTGVFVAKLAGSLVVELGSGIALSHIFKSHEKWIKLLKALKVARAGSKVTLVAPSPEGGSKLAAGAGFVASEALIWGVANIMGQTVRKQLGITDKYYASELIASALAGVSAQPLNHVVAKGMAPKLGIGKGLADYDIWKGTSLRVAGRTMFVSGAALGLTESVIRQEIAVMLNEQENRHVWDYLLAMGIGGGLNSVFGMLGRTGAWGRAMEDRMFRRGAATLVKQVKAKERFIQGAKKYYEDEYFRDLRITPDKAGNYRFLSKADFAKHKAEIAATNPAEAAKLRRASTFEESDYGKKLGQELADLKQSQLLLDDFTIKFKQKRLFEDQIEVAKRQGKAKAPQNPAPEHYPKPGETPAPKPPVVEPEAPSVKVEEPEAPTPKPAEEPEAPVVKDEEPEAPVVKDEKPEATTPKPPEEPETAPPTEPALGVGDTPSYPSYREVPENLDDLQAQLIEMRRKAQEAIGNKTEGTVVPEVTQQARRMVEEIDFETTTLIQALATDGVTLPKMAALRRELEAAHLIYDELLGTFSAMQGRGLQVQSGAWLNSGLKYKGPISHETMRLKESLKALMDDIDRRLISGVDDVDALIAGELPKLLRKGDPELRPAEEVIKSPAKPEKLRDTLIRVKNIIDNNGNLDDVSYRDVQKLAKELGVPAKGKKKDIIENIKNRETTATAQAKARAQKKPVKTPAEKLADNIASKIKSLQEKLESYYPTLTKKDPDKTPKTGDAAKAKVKEEIDKNPEVIALKKSLKHARAYQNEVNAVIAAEAKAAKLAAIAARGDPDEMAAALATKKPTKKQLNQRLAEAQKGVKAAKALMRDRLARSKAEEDAQLWNDIYMFAYDELRARAVGKWSTIWRGARVARKLAMINSVTSVQAAVPTGLVAVGRLMFKSPAYAVKGRFSKEEAAKDLNYKMAQVAWVESVRALKGTWDAIATMSTLGKARKDTQTSLHMRRTFKEGADPQFGGRAISQYDDYTDATRAFNPRGLDQVIKFARRNAINDAKAAGTINKFIDDNSKTGAFFRFMSIGARGIQAVDAGLRRQVSIAERNMKMALLGHLEHPNDPTAAAKKTQELIKAHTRDQNGLTLIRETDQIAEELAEVERAFLLLSQRDNIQDVHEAMSEKLIRLVTSATQNDTHLGQQLTGSFIEFLMPFFSVAVRSVVRGTHLTASPTKLAAARFINPHVKVRKDLENELKIALEGLKRRKAAGKNVEEDEGAIADLQKRIDLAESRKVRWNHEVLTDTMLWLGVAGTTVAGGYLGVMSGSQAWMTPDQKKKSTTKAYKIKTPMGSLDYRTWVPLNILMTVSADLGGLLRAQNEGRLSKDVSIPQALAQSTMNITKDLPTSGLGTLVDVQRSGDTVLDSWTRLASTVIPMPSQAKKIIQAAVKKGTISDFRGQAYWKRVAYHALGTGPKSKKVDLFGDDIDTGKTPINAFFRFGGERNPEKNKFVIALAKDHESVVHQAIPDTFYFNMKMRDFVDHDGVTLRYRFAQELRKSGIKKEVFKYLNKDFARDEKRFNKNDGRNLGLIKLNEILVDNYRKVREDLLKDKRFLSQFVSIKKGTEDQNLYDMIQLLEKQKGETIRMPAPLPNP